MDAYKNRIANVQKGMRERGVDCFIVSNSSTLLYLTGFALAWAEERLMALVLTNSAEPFWIANKLYTQELSHTSVEDRIIWEDGENAFAILADALKQRGCEPKSIMVDQVMPSQFLLPIIGLYPDAKLLPEKELMVSLRICKDELELEYMRTACKHADEALQLTISGTDWVGHTELDFMSQLNLEMTRRGLTKVGTLACTGANAAMPHHNSDNTVIQAGSCLLVDFGCAYRGYQSDMTRDFYFGEPPAEYQKVYDIVLEALYAGHEAARRGGMLHEVDDAARGVITKHGYGEYFTHRTGHGIGIDGHEEPYVSGNSEVAMRPGMAFSIEPGIYLPGKFGVRIEDQAAVLEGGGIEIFHHFPRELYVVR